MILKRGVARSEFRKVDVDAVAHHVMAPLVLTIDLGELDRAVLRRRDCHRIRRASSRIISTCC